MTGFKGCDRFDFEVLIGGLLFTLMYEQSLKAAITSIVMWLMISTLHTLFGRKKPRTIPADLVKALSRGGLGSSAIRHGRRAVVTGEQAITPAAATKNCAPACPDYHTCREKIASQSASPPIVLGPASVTRLQKGEQVTYVPTTYSRSFEPFSADTAREQAAAQITDAMDRLRAAGHHSIEMKQFRAYCLSTMRAAEFEEGVHALTLPTLTRHTMPGPTTTLLLLTY